MSVGDRSMQLKVLKPSRVVMEKEVVRMLFATEDGYYCLLPRHVDFITVLVPGVLVFEDTAGLPGYVRLQDGMLVKCGREVLASTSDAVMVSGVDQDAGAQQGSDTAARDREHQARAVVAGLQTRFSRDWLRTSEED
ncbi:MAG: hypothetical protein ACYCXF_07965 [Thermoleophilia bacterium]